MAREDKSPVVRPYLASASSGSARAARRNPRRPPGPRRRRRRHNLPLIIGMRPSRWPPKARPKPWPSSARPRSSSARVITKRMTAATKAAPLRTKVGQASRLPVIPCSGRHSVLRVEGDFPVACLYRCADLDRNVRKTQPGMSSATVVPEVFGLAPAERTGRRFGMSGDAS